MTTTTADFEKGLRLVTSIEPYFTTYYYHLKWHEGMSLFEYDACLKCRAVNEDFAKIIAQALCEEREMAMKEWDVK